MDIAPGVRMLAGSDGTLPVSLRWVLRTGDWPEAIAVKDGLVIVASDVLSAFALTDGRKMWEALPPDGEALGGSGGGVLSAAGVDQVRAWLPFEADMTVRQVDGHVVRFSRDFGAARPAELTPVPAPVPEQYTFETGLDKIVARRPDGSVAWLITIDEPMVDELPPIGVPGGVLLTTSSRHVLLVDYR